MGGHLYPRKMLRIHRAIAALIALPLAAGVMTSPVIAGEVPVAGAGPVVISPDNAFAYVGAGTSVVRVTLSGMTSETIATLSAPAGCHDNVTALGISPDSQVLYAGSYNCVYRIELTNGNAVTAGATGIGEWINAIAVGSSAAYATTDNSGGGIAKASKVSGVWQSTWTRVGAGLNADAVLSNDGATLYTTIWWGIRAFNTSAGTESSVPGGTFGTAISLAPDSSYLATVDQNRVSKTFLTGPNAGTRTTVAMPINLNDLTIDPTGSFIYVSGRGAKAILKLQASDLSVLSRHDFSGSEEPQRLAQPSSVSDLLVATTSTRVLTFPMAPSAPTGLTATPGDQSATLAFTAGSDGLGTITNYEVKIDGGSWAPVSPADTTSPITVSGLTNGTESTIEVRAVTATLNGAPSSAVTVTPRRIPDAPTSLTAVPGDRSASVSFSAGYDGGSALTNIEYRVNGGAWTALSPSDTTSPVSIPGLSAATASSIELRARNAAGASDASSAVSVTPFGPPGAPTSLAATPGDGRAIVSFVAGSNQGSAITNYEVSIDGGPWSALSPADATSPVTVTGLTNGAAASISLRAVNAAGSGAASSSISVTPQAAVVAGGSSSMTREPSASPSPTPTPTSSAPAPAPVVVPEPVAVGQGLIVIDGRTTRVDVQVVAGRKWQVKGEDFTLEFIPKAELGEIEGVFSARAGTTVEVRGDGFLPGSLVASYLPGALASSLGEAKVRADGTFTVDARFPSTMPEGQYVFQVNGLRSETSVRSVNLGLRLLAAPANVASRAVGQRIMFRPGSAELTPAAKTTITRFVSRNRQSASSAIVVPTVRLGASAQDRALAVKRAKAVVAAMRASGLAVPTRPAKVVRVVKDSRETERATAWIRR